ncbi:Glycosyltransferase family 9 (heptosyltransferase) [compost metagenome]
MRVLVVSLLRLGDLIQQKALLDGLRHKHPRAEIHLLLNRQFSNAEKILTGTVDKYLYFEREQLQKGLGEAEYNILWSFSQLQNLVNDVNATSYDVVYNFTHTKLSAYLIGAFEIKEKKGLHQKSGRFAGLDTGWIRYFNDRFSGNQNCFFNYVELLAKSFDIPLKNEMAKKSETKKSKIILFQCLTSDSKKNWGLERFVALKKEIETTLIDFKIRILGASFEKEILLQFFREDELLICDLVEAQKHLKDARLLVTGDTSIKHMAAQMGTPIVELVIGSSDAVKTGAFSDKSRQVLTTAACAPCVHSAPCSQKSHLCAEDVTVEKVFIAVWGQLSDEKRNQQITSRILEKTIWGHYLDGQMPTMITLVDFAQRLRSSGGKDLLAWDSRTTELDSFLQRLAEALPSQQELQGKSSLSASDVADLILVAQDILKSKKDEGGYFQKVLEGLLTKHANPLHFMVKMTEAIAEARGLIAIRKEFIFNLKSISKEGELYAKGIGQLSGCSFEEARESLQRNIKSADL